MNNNILPIGSVIEFEGHKLIIINYEYNNDHLEYLCAGYPTFWLIDLIPSNKIQEYKSKYNNYNTDNSVRVDADFKIICEGYKNADFENFVSGFEF